MWVEVLLDGSLGHRQHLVQGDLNPKHNTSAEGLYLTIQLVNLCHVQHPKFRD